LNLFAGCDFWDGRWFGWRFFVGCLLGLAGLLLFAAKLDATPLCLELRGRPAKNALSMKRDCLALAAGFLACLEGPWFIAFYLGFLFCVCAQRYPIGY